MTSRFGIPWSYKSRPQQSILNLISGCSFSFHRPFVSACCTHDPTEASWSPSPCFFALFLPSLKSIELIFPPRPQRHHAIARNWWGTHARAVMNFICCKLTAIGWSHSLIIKCNEITANKSSALVYSSALAQTHPLGDLSYSACVAPPLR